MRSRSIYTLALMLLLTPCFVPLYGINLAGSVAYSNPTISTVNTSSGSTATLGPWNRHVIYDQGMWWVFWTQSNHIQYATSSDGSTWSINSTIAYAPNGGEHFAIWQSGNTLYYVRTNDTTRDTHLYYRYGDLTQSRSITWLIPEQNITTNFANVTNVNIALDSSHNLWLAARTRQIVGSHSNYYINIFTNYTGIWTQVYNDTPTIKGNLKGTLLPLYNPSTGTSGMAYVYGWGSPIYITSTTNGGANWTPIVSTSSSYQNSEWSAVSVNDSIYFDGVTDVGNVNYWRYVNGNGSAPIENTLDSGTNNLWATMSTNGSSTFVEINSRANNSIVYRISTNAGAEWSPPYNITTSETSVLLKDGSAVWNTVNNEVGLEWTNGTSSPYDVRFGLFTARLPTSTTTTTSISTTTNSGPVCTISNTNPAVGNWVKISCSGFPPSSSTQAVIFNNSTNSMAADLFPGGTSSSGTLQFSMKITSSMAGINTMFFYSPKTSSIPLTSLVFNSGSTTTSTTTVTTSSSTSIITTTTSSTITATSTTTASTSASSGPACSMSNTNPAVGNWVKISCSGFPPNGSTLKVTVFNNSTNSYVAYLSPGHTTDSSGNVQFSMKITSSMAGTDTVFLYSPAGSSTPLASVEFTTV